jgi:hypothetical protein
LAGGLPGGLPKLVWPSDWSRQGFGAPDWQVEAWVTSYIAIATGEMDVVTDAVEKITGKSASALEPFLRANPHLWEKLAVARDTIKSAAEIHASFKRQLDADAEPDD